MKFQLEWFRITTIVIFCLFLLCLLYLSVTGNSTSLKSCDVKKKCDVTTGSGITTPTAFWRCGCWTGKRGGGLQFFQVVISTSCSIKQNVKIKQMKKFLKVCKRRIVIHFKSFNFNFCSFSRLWMIKASSNVTHKFRLFLQWVSNSLEIKKLPSWSLLDIGWC